MRYEHKKLGFAVDLPDLKQRELEAFFASMREKGIDINKISSVEYAGGAVRLAAELGWLNGLGDPGGLSPKLIVWIASKISRHVAEVLTIPPE
jgi:hypothetical protein